MYKDESIFQNGGPHGKYHKFEKNDVGSHVCSWTAGQYEQCFGTAG